MKKISSLLQGYRYILTAEILRLIKGESSPPVFMCIGGSLLTGDRLGPTVGRLLIKKHDVPAFVYGTPERPVTARNVMDVHDFIRRAHGGKIFAIDAALGRNEEKGIISVFKGGIRPAAAMCKNYPAIGDYSMTVNVNAVCAQNVVALATVREKMINELAENIAFAINDALILHKAYCEIGIKCIA